MTKANDITPVVVRRPRILHLIEATLGGSLKYVNDVIQSLPMQSFDCAIAYSTRRADPGLKSALDEARKKGWKTFLLEMVREISPREDIRSALQARSLINEYRPDILHCHSSKAGAIGRLAAMSVRSRPRVLYSPHAVAANMGTKYLAIERFLALFTDRFGAVSEGERMELTNLGLVSGERVDVVYPTVNTSHYFPMDRSSARAALQIPFDVRLIVGVGRLTEQKDPLRFVEIVEELLKRRRDVRAVWLGEGSLRPEVEAAIAAKQLREVIQLASWKADVRPHLAAADLLLSTSRYESFGYMVAEALAMARPVVATRIPGTSDIMDGQLADLLYPAADVCSAIEKILCILNDRDHAACIGEMGRKSIEDRFSQERMCAALSVSYTQLVSKMHRQSGSTIERNDEVANA